ncbi:FAS1-like dehydratase domain-containing protein [Halopiger goleimassiliensis]|uniref:FAS1-like dehydratase domain-containing protein n=1 Tax=Halopiger goleimassiliensis TaxID=1293048 RepID=UPI0006776E94|nr:MaoC family dehydratase N-terminal domain-containing protein [Halopiger goleimassiliensis]
MPTKPLSELEGLVGESRVTVEDFRIERGKVAEFARAITDPNPIYSDPDAAREAGHDRIPAPLTYTRVSRFPRYSATEDDGYGFDLGFRQEYVLHGEQAYEYERPLYVGDVVTGETTLADVFQREGGRAGTMTFAVFETEYRDRDGDLVLTARATAIETEGAVDDEDSTDDVETDADDEEGSETAVADPDSVDPVRSLEDLAVGDSGPTVVVDDVERKHFVKYAGASGDFNPIHYDEPYAREAGNPSVFGQGMFTAGVTSRVVTDWFGIDAVDSFGVRFQSRVFPGDTVIATGEVVDVGDGTVEVELEARADRGETLLSGTASATLEE